MIGSLKKKGEKKRGILYVILLAMLFYYALTDIPQWGDIDNLLFLVSFLGFFAIIFYIEKTIEDREQEYKYEKEQMLMRYECSQQLVECLPDHILSKVITIVASQDPEKLPETISEECLNAIIEPLDIAILWDFGYRASNVFEGVDHTINEIVARGIAINYDPELVTTLTYANVIALEQWISQLSPAEWQKIIDSEAQITLNVEFWKFNVRGERVNKGNWKIDYPPQSKMTQSEKDRYIDQQNFYNEWYWSDEAIAQRQKEREESYEYYHEKDLEGWKEYYAILDAMKLYPDAYEYWSQPGKFAELRRKWEISGIGLPWEQWLAQFDFEGAWYKLPPP